MAWLRTMVRKLPGRRRTIYVRDRVPEYRSLWVAAALALGATFAPISDDFWEIQRDGHRTRIANDLVEFDDPVVLSLAGNKSSTYAIAKRLGVPTPDPRTYGRSDLERLVRTLPIVAEPYVVKPATDTGSGIGVTVGVRSRSRLASAVGLASLHSSSVIVERLVAAETVRLLFLDGRLIDAVRRRGVRVHGDGASTIAELLARPGVRGPGQSVDWFVQETLRQQGHSARDVLPADETIVARWLPAGVAATDELRTTYDEQITDLVGTALVDEVGAIVSAIGSRFAGVDVLTNDPSRSLAESGGVFLEVNTTPSLHHHCIPSPDAAPCAIAVAVLDRLLEGSRA